MFSMALNVKKIYFRNKYALFACPLCGRALNILEWQNWWQNTLCLTVNDLPTSWAATKLSRVLTNIVSKSSKSSSLLWNINNDRCQLWYRGTIQKFDFIYKKIWFYIQEWNWEEDLGVGPDLGTGPKKRKKMNWYFWVDYGWSLIMKQCTYHFYSWVLSILVDCD